MRTATGLTLIAIGAILAFAITASPGFLNIQTVGLILMATGAVGLALSARNRNLLRRRIVVRRSQVPRRRQRVAKELPPPAAPDDETKPIQRETFDEYIEQ